MKPTFTCHLATNSIATTSKRLRLNMAPNEAMAIATQVPKMTQVDTRFCVELWKNGLHLGMLFVKKGPRK